MTCNRPPYIGSVRIQEWITKDKQRINGIQLRGAWGLAAHLTPGEARTLADTLHDLADQLEQATETPEHREPPRVLQPAYTSRSTLTAADGHPEPLLPATSAD
ncbi:hypothetical protein C1H84_15550 [Glutamicibacter soli]|uniref:Uncharacterized protein n=1 Tax=Glutamicibacter soli TaxID=453836 RepID=A0A365Y9M4_9MICC|nr:hypothetical protein C1H84_15550 [Glutamicibacter soli]